MSKSINNPNKFGTNDEPETSAFTPSGLTDDTDFPHTGLFKALNLGVQGNYPVSGFNITAATATGFNVAAGKVMRDGALIDTNAVSLTLSTVHTNGYHLLVAPTGSSPVNPVLRNPTAANKVPDYTAGDTVIAIVAYVGSTGPLQVQYLTNNKTENSLSIGRDNSGYTESASIKSNAGDVEIKALEQDKDIIFKVNDGGSDTEIMRIDGSESRVGIGVSNPTGLFHVKGTSASAIDFMVEVAEDGASASPDIVYFRNSASPAAGDDLAHIRFRGRDSAGNTADYVDIFAEIVDPTDGGEDGRITFRTLKNNVIISRIELDSDETVINDSGADVNFRVEGDTEANLIFVDAGNDKVGIGTNTPSEVFSVQGNIRSSGDVIVGGDLDHNGSNISFFATAAASKQTVGNMGTTSVGTLPSADPTLLPGFEPGNHAYIGSLETEIGNLRTKLDALIDALQLYGLIS